MNRFLASFLCAFFITMPGAQAQDAKSARAPSGTPLLQNEQVRVLDLRFPPGARSTPASHPNRFLYALTDGGLVFTEPGKKSYELSFKNGEALWLPAQSVAAANEGNKEVRVLVVEIKAAPRARGVTGKRSGAGARKASRGKKAG